MDGSSSGSESDNSNEEDVSARKKGAVSSACAKVQELQNQDNSDSDDETVGVLEKD